VHPNEGFSDEPYSHFFRKATEPLIPKGKADIVVALEPLEALRVLTVYGNPETVVIINTRPIYPVDVTSGDEKYPEREEMEKALKSLSKKAYFISATERAMEMGSPLLMNMIMIGALLESNLLPMRFEEFKHTLSENSPTRH